MSTIRFAEDVARTLVRLLANDDDFRRAFSLDPVAALKHHGLRPVDGYASMHLNHRCLLVERLAPKEEIAQASVEINRMLTSGISQIAPALDADRPGTKLLEVA